MGMRKEYSCSNSKLLSSIVHIFKTVIAVCFKLGVIGPQVLCYSHCRLGPYFSVIIVNDHVDATRMNSISGNDVTQDIGLKLTFN